MKNYERVLVLGPHTDDGEYACGGSIARFVEQGTDCFYAAFSSCDESLPEDFEKGITKIEFKNATAMLGMKEENLIIYDFRVRHFPQLRQEILEEMVVLQRDIKPDLVLLPTKFDTHQDHSVIAHEGFRAFKRSSMLGYEAPWNNLTFISSGFIEIEERHLERKIEAVGMYKSQEHRSYSSPDYIRSLAVTRGVQIGVQLAEAFEVVRSINRI